MSCDHDRMMCVNDREKERGAKNILLIKNRTQAAILILESYHSRNIYVHIEHNTLAHINIGAFYSHDFTQ